MEQNTQLKRLNLECYACERTSAHVMILYNVSQAGMLGTYPIMRDLSLYGCEDCGSVRIQTFPSNEGNDI